MPTTFNYANHGAYTYHHISPGTYKFSTAPAFHRPPTPPQFLPPSADPFAEKDPAVKKEELDDAKDADGPESVEAPINEAGICYSIRSCSLMLLII